MPIGRRIVGSVALGMAGVLALSGCTTSLASERRGIEPNPFTAMIEPKLLSPVKDGATGVSPATPMSFEIADGQFTEVTLLSPDNRPVPGALSEDHRKWVASEPLGYARNYRLQTKALGLGGAANTSLAFSTINPRNKAKPYLTPATGETVGIGQPVAIQFDEAIPNRKAAQDAITVRTTPPVEGAFYWVNDREVRWRPEHFWAPGEKINVDVNAYGKDLGGGLYGEGDIHSDFTIGDPVVFTADDNTKEVVVQRNGKTIRTMPTSMGKSSTPTNNGIYIIADRHSQIIMDSSTYGVAVNSGSGYRVKVDYATRMSYSGIFMHSAPWSVGAQGNTDTSHGCLNLSPSDARWVYENAKRGDITIVKNSPGKVLSGVDGLGDWNIPWDQWKAGNADSR